MEDHNDQNSDIDSCNKTSQNDMNNDHEIIIIPIHSLLQQQQQQSLLSSHHNEHNEHQNRNVHHIQKGAMAGDGTTSQEAMIGLASGIIYGFVSPTIGHPFDSIKTRMQADPIYRNLNFRQTITRIYYTDGILNGYYRGFIPPLIGSMIFRGLQFSVYAGSYSAYETYINPYMIGDGAIPYTGGLRPSVLFGAIVASFVRSLIESPLDYIKVRKMVGQNTFDNHHNHNDNTIHKPNMIHYNNKYIINEIFKSPYQNIKQLYNGFIPTLLRTFGLLGSFFIMVDYSVRYIPDIINTPYYGPFFKGGICATTAWIFAFPFETVKSIIQADTTGKYNNMRYATFHVLKRVYKERGIIHGIYRGFGPGASRSFIANGTSMIVFSKVQEIIRNNI